VTVSLRLVHKFHDPLKSWKRFSRTAQIVLHWQSGRFHHQERAPISRGPRKRATVVITGYSTRKLAGDTRITSSNRLHAPVPRTRRAIRIAILVQADFPILNADQCGVYRRPKRSRIAERGAGCHAGGTCARSNFHRRYCAAVSGDKPIYLAGHQRIYEGVRIAGVPDGKLPANVRWRPFPLRVKLRRTQSEQKSSQLPRTRTLLNTVGTSHLCQHRTCGQVMPLEQREYQDRLHRSRPHVRELEAALGRESSPGGRTEIAP
jgi:hypothetical protein